MKTNIFSVDVAVEETPNNFFWTSFPHYQNIQFTEVIEVCNRHKFWRVNMFVEVTDEWIEIANSIGE